MDEQGARAIATAMSWVARIFAVVALMALPAVAGSYLDHRWETRWMTPTGAAFGLVTGVSYLLVITRTRPSDPRNRDD
ncbi:MAG: hypothetical protein KDA44_01895 [Planctomycetales bacterium]|nr:hypothetical protein [Planctomycetales bacterium]